MIPAPDCCCFSPTQAPSPTPRGGPTPKAQRPAKPKRKTPPTPAAVLEESRIEAVELLTRFAADLRKTLVAARASDPTWRAKLSSLADDSFAILQAGIEIEKINDFL